jgi:hypothetical protein
LIIVNNFGDGGPGNCTTTCTLRDALAVGLASDPIKGVGFSASSGWPQTITLTQGQLSINNTSGSILYVTGPGAAQLAISANSLSRVLQASAGSTVVSDLTLRDGMVAGVSPGPQGDFTGSAGQAGGAATGGCISIDASATLTLDRSEVRNCIALGGTGGAGGSGSLGGFSGGAGGAGGTIFGGCINVAGGATMALDQVDVRNCAATGGKGGKGGRGGDGSPGRGGDGGAGGAGAQASGGAIYAAGNLTLLRSSVALSNATGGDGGTSDFPGAGSHNDGNGGAGGPGGVAAGGAVYVASSGMALIRNTTLAGDIAAGGHGGSGGVGGNASSGGNGGAGGLASGGLLHGEGPSSAVDVEFTTFANGAVIPGPGGSAGLGATNGIPGTPGEVHGAAINADGSVTIQSAVVVGAAAAALCSGNVGVAPSAANLDQDSSCPGFTLHGSFEQTLLPLSLATTSWPAYMPVYHGAAIDASASCTQIDGAIVVPDDQHGTLRPQGGACDLGAIEADYIFVGTFD